MADKPPREPDCIWDVCVELYGDVSNRAERGKRNRAVAELKESGATPDEIRRRDAVMRRDWKHLGRFTANGLSGNWTSFEDDEPVDDYWTPERLQQLEQNGYVRT